MSTLKDKRAAELTWPACLSLGDGLSFGHRVVVTDKLDPIAT